MASQKFYPLALRLAFYNIGNHKIIDPLHLKDRDATYGQPPKQGQLLKICCNVVNACGNLLCIINWMWQPIFKNFFNFAISFPRRSSLIQGSGKYWEVRPSGSRGGRQPGCPARWCVWRHFRPPRHEWSSDRANVVSPETKSDHEAHKFKTNFCNGSKNN